MKCPRCEATVQQHKAGLNPSKSQRYECGECHKIYTPQPTPKGYQAETRMLALRMYVEGNSYHAIGRILKVNPQSVVNWVKAYSAGLPAAPVPDKPKTAELDELYTFIGKKKTKFTS